MIKEIRIKNFKSVQKLKLELGRVNVLIGENGCGKSNILEAIAMASASASGKLDNEFLASRGIRVTHPQMMRSAFEKEFTEKNIEIFVFGENDEPFESELMFNTIFDTHGFWEDLNHKKLFQKMGNIILPILDNKTSVKDLTKDKIEILSKAEKEFIDEIKKLNKKGYSTNIGEIFRGIFEQWNKTENLHQFLIYSPENSALRVFEKEGQIQPLGIRGEGLFKFLKYLSQKENTPELNKIRENLKLLDWFEDFDIPKDLYANETRLQIKDRFLDPTLELFDQKSANEGFLFLLFYITLFVSEETPKFFAIDNIDASLNPKLCRELIKILTKLAQEHNKQVIFTTHNPAILDGLNLNDDEQRLFVVRRNVEGHTKAFRYTKPKLAKDERTVRMSEAFLRGYIGGLPNNF